MHICGTLKRSDYFSVFLPDAHFYKIFRECYLSIDYHQIPG